jgi:outer membrane protein OmpU
MQNHEGISMKSILLASASIVGFASVAAADGHAAVSFGGSASVGYNDEVKGGFFWEGDLSVSMSATLNNGLTAAGSFGLNIADNDTGQAVTSADWVVSLTSETAGMYFGHTDMAAQKLWSGIDGMEADGFGENGDVGDATLRGELTYGAVTAAVSYGVVAGGDLVGLQVAADATFGNFNVGVAYQDDAFGSEIMGVSLGTTLGAAGVNLAYADNGAETSIGVSVSYPAGPVTLGAYYATNDVAGDAYGISAAYASGAVTVDAGYDVAPGASDGDFDLEATYDVGNGIKAWAGILNNGDVYYVAGTVDLGGGASLLVSYADDGDAGAAPDDIGAPELNDGTTVKVSFSF